MWNSETYYRWNCIRRGEVMVLGIFAYTVIAAAGIVIAAVFMLFIKIIIKILKG